MRELTFDGSANVERRRKAFDRVLEERFPVPTDFMELLELPNPALVLTAADDEEIARA